LTEVFLTLSEVFPCFFLSGKANARVKLAKTGARSALFHISYYLCCSMYFFVCTCVLYYCHRVSTQLQLTNISYIIYHIPYHIILCHGMSCHVVSCRVVSCHVVSCRVVSCRVVSCHVVSCRVVSCRVVSCRVMSCHVMSYHIISSYHISYHIISYIQFTHG